jgi:predicted HTH transcriptional regulator
LNKGKITNAAILLFGKEPQRFFLTSEVKCAHFHGKIVEKPIPFYQVYKGNLFELVDQAVNFVLSKIDFAVGTRAKGPIVPTAYEIPPEVIEEAVVNAIAHRDYNSVASVQVMRR